MTQLKLTVVPPHCADLPQTIELPDAATVEKPQFRIGRRQRDCNIVLHSEFVSKRHLELNGTSHGWTLIDMGSRAGTKLNDVRIKPHVAYPLHHGDEIRFCGYQFMVVENESESRNGGSDELPVIASDSGFASVIAKPERSWSHLTAVSAENKLQLLLEIIRDLRHPAEIDEQLRRLIDRLFKLVPKSCRGTVMVKHHPSRANGFFVSVTRRNDCTQQEAGLRQSVMDKVLNEQSAVLTEDRQVICVPLVDRDDHTLGCLQLESDGRNDRFSDRELELLSGAGLLISFAIENDVYYAAVARDRAQQQELRMAREIQKRLLPAPCDRAGPIELFTFYDAALQVGGDYYDVVELPTHQLAVAVGDVSGKGMPAGLLMAKISSEIRILLDIGLRPAQVLQRVNQRLVERTTAGSFVTLALLTIDLNTHEMLLAIAGHPRPMLRLPGGSVEDLCDAEAGLALGIDPAEQYTECVMTLPLGATVVLFSDGVTEARSKANEEFGTERLRAAVQSAPSSAHDLGHAVLDGVEAFLGEQAHQDDLCLVCLRRDA